MPIKCTTCGGVYGAVDKDGVPYFHACAPTWNAGTKTYDERAQKRDENLVQNPQTGAVTLKAIGQGTTTV